MHIITTLHAIIFSTTSTYVAIVLFIFVFTTLYCITRYFVFVCLLFYLWQHPLCCICAWYTIFKKWRVWLCSHTHVPVCIYIYIYIYVAKYNIRITRLNESSIFIMWLSIRKYSLCAHIHTIPFVSPSV